MALSTVTVTITDQWYNGRRLVVLGTIAIQGTPGTYPAGGLVVDFSAVGVKSTLVPVFCQIAGKSGFIYAYSNGTNSKDGKIMVFCEQTTGTNVPLLEHTVTTTVAGVAADTISFEAVFKMR